MLKTALVNGIPVDQPTKETGLLASTVVTLSFEVSSIDALVNDLLHYAAELTEESRERKEKTCTKEEKEWDENQYRMKRESRPSWYDTKIKEHLNENMKKNKEI